MNTQTPTARIIDDPAGTCLAMLIRARTSEDFALVSTTARRLLQGANTPGPVQAAEIRSMVRAELSEDRS